MSEENRPKKKPRRHQRKRRPQGQKGQSKNRPNNSSNQAKRADGQNTQRPQAQDNNNKNSSQNRNRSRNRNRNKNRNRNNNKKPTITTRGVVAAYLETVGRYLKARADYFDSFRGVVNKKVRRTFDNYQSQLKKLRGFEGTLKPWQKEELDKNIEFFPKDTEFSSNHPKDEIAETVPEGEDKVFFHELISQKERPRYASDTEETEGSLEDYTKYKESIIQ